MSKVLALIMSRNNPHSRQKVKESLAPNKKETKTNSQKNINLFDTRKLSEQQDNSLLPQKLSVNPRETSFSIRKERHVKFSVYY